MGKERQQTSVCVQDFIWKDHVSFWYRELRSEARYSESWPSCCFCFVSLAKEDIPTASKRYCPGRSRLWECVRYKWRLTGLSSNIAFSFRPENKAYLEGLGQLFAAAKGTYSNDSSVRSKEGN